MKKEELLEIGLTDEQADKVFALNGKDVEKYKSQAAEAKKDVTDLRDQLTQRDKDIEDLKKNAGDADDLRRSTTPTPQNSRANLMHAIMRTQYAPVSPQRVLSLPPRRQKRHLSLT